MNNKKNNKTIINTLVFFVLTIFISSCSIQKRHYMPGYHVEYGKSKALKSTSSLKDEEIKIADNNKEAENNIIAEENLSASADNEIKVIDKNNLNLFFHSSKKEFNKTIESNKKTIKNVQHKIKKQSGFVSKVVKDKSITFIGVLSIIFLAIALFLIVPGVIYLLSAAGGVGGVLLLVLAIPFLLLGLVFGSIWLANKDKE